MSYIGKTKVSYYNLRIYIRSNILQYLPDYNLLLRTVIVISLNLDELRQLDPRKLDSELRNLRRMDTVTCNFGGVNPQYARNTLARLSMGERTFTRHRLRLLRKDRTRGLSMSCNVRRPISREVLRIFQSTEGSLSAKLHITISRFDVRGEDAGVGA